MELVAYRLSALRSAGMNALMLRILLLACLALSACATRGVAIDDDQCAAAMGWNERQVRLAYGVPHRYSEDSDGVILMAYGVKHESMLAWSHTDFVEFTLIDDRVVKTRRYGHRPIANKNRAR